MSSSEKDILCQVSVVTGIFSESIYCVLYGYDYEGMSLCYVGKDYDKAKEAFKEKVTTESGDEIVIQCWIDGKYNCNKASWRKS